MLSRSACLLVAMVLAVSGCAHVAGVGPSELARLRELREVLAVHYVAPPPEFMVWKKGHGRGEAFATAMTLGVVLLPAMILFPPLREGPRAVEQAILAKAATSLGREVTSEIALEDPITTLKEDIVSRLAGEGAIPHTWSAIVDGSDDIESLRQRYGPVTVFDVRTTAWQLRHHFADPETYIVVYQVKSRLIRLDQRKVVWNAESACAAGGDRRFGLPTLPEVRADGGALLKAALARAAEICAEAMVAKFQGRQFTPPPPQPGVDVTVEPSTLLDAHTRLFGPVGLVAGSVKFDAKFKKIALRDGELPELRKILSDAAASPWGSEVQFRGTVDGVPFKAKIEKGSAGRSEFTFEGFRFENAEQATAFVAPLRGRGVREVKLVGIAGGRPFKTVLTPSSPPAVSEVSPSAIGIPSASAPTISAPSWATSDANAGYREHCRHLHLMRSDWRHYLPAYERCLAR